MNLYLSKMNGFRTLVLASAVGISTLMLGHYSL